MTPDEEFRSMMIRVVPIALFAFTAGGLLLHYFMRSLAASEDSEGNENEVRPGVRFIILVLVLFVLAMLFTFIAYRG